MMIRAEHSYVAQPFFTQPIISKMVAVQAANHVTTLVLAGVVRALVGLFLDFSPVLRVKRFLVELPASGFGFTLGHVYILPNLFPEINSSPFRGIKTWKQFYYPDNDACRFSDIR